MSRSRRILLKLSGEALMGPDGFGYHAGTLAGFVAQIREVTELGVQVGIVVGGGNEFNMSCDLAVAADDIYIRHVGTSHGSVPLAGATQFLPLIVGERRAREILFLNEEISAAKAEDWGLINWAVPRAQLDAKVDEIVEKLKTKFPEKTRYAKQQLNFWRDLSWHTTIGHGRDWLAVHNTSPETWEGVQSFEEKRKPDYGEIRRRWAEDDAPEWLGGEMPSYKE